MTDLHVVLVSWNRRDETLAAVRRVAGWQRLEPWIWVVDNGSSDGSAEAVANEFPGVRLIALAENLGYGGANNEALAEIDGGYVLLLNGDAWIDEETVGRMLEFLEHRQRVAVVGPLLEERWGDRLVVKAGGRDIAIHPRTHLRLNEIPSSVVEAGEGWEVPYVPGTALLMRSSLTSDLGPLDPNYFFAGEVADLCERARRHGRSSAVLTAARASHDMGGAGESRTGLYPYYILRNRFLFIRKHRRNGLVFFFLFWILWALYAMLRAAIGGRRGEVRLLRLGLVDGLVGRFGGQNERILGP